MGNPRTKRIYGPIPEHRSDIMKSVIPQAYSVLGLECDETLDDLDDQSPWNPMERVIPIITEEELAYLMMDPTLYDQDTWLISSEYQVCICSSASNNLAVHKI